MSFLGLFVCLFDGLSFWLSAGLLKKLRMLGSLRTAISIHFKNRYICTAICYWLVCVLGLQPIAWCVHADSVSMRQESVELWMVVR